MTKRSSDSQALHDGFEQHVLPVLAALGFTQIEVPPDQRAVGWTTLLAECALPSGIRLRAELACHGTASPRFHLMGPSGQIALTSTEGDPAAPKRPTVSHAMASFVVAADVRQGGEAFARRRVLALEFLAGALAATSDQLVAAVPELGPRVAAAAQSSAWRDAAERARVLWANRAVRSEVEDRPVAGTFTFVGAALATIEAENQRFTFRFDTSRIDRTRTPIVSGWWTTPAGTRKPSTLTVGDLVLTFDPSGKHIGG